MPNEDTPPAPKGATHTFIDGECQDCGCAECYEWPCPGPLVERPRACAVPGCLNAVACVGSYDGAPEAYACDEHCGHGNEDGWCGDADQDGGGVVMSAPTDTEVDEDALDQACDGLDGLDWRDVVELLVRAEAARDRLAAEVDRLKSAHAAELEKAYNEGWNEGSGWAGVSS